MASDPEAVVDGDYVTTSLDEFENKCIRLIEEERRLGSPNTRLIDCLSEAIRCKRELARGLWMRSRGGAEELEGRDV